MSQTNHHRIELYLSGEMSLVEKEEFLKHLKTNPSLQEEFDLYRQIESDMGFWEKNKADIRAFQDNIQKADPSFAQTKHSKETPFIKSKAFKAILLAAAVFLGIIIFIPENKTLYQTYAQHEKIGFAQKAPATTNKLEEIAHFFNEKNFQKCLNKINTLKAKPEDPEVIFIQAVCILELNKPEKSRLMFIELSEKYPAFENKCQFYIALSYLKELRYDKALKEFKIIEKNSVYYTKSTEIIQAIEALNSKSQ